MTQKSSLRDLDMKTEFPEINLSTNLYYTPLLLTKDRILMKIQDKKFFKWLEKIKTSSFCHDKTKYCYFHKDHGHDIDDYHTLKDKIVFLIRKVYLEQFT